MTIPLASIKAGKCYLNHIEYGVRILRVTAILPGNRVQYDSRSFSEIRGAETWKAGLLSKADFALLIERQVPCDWTPETDKGAG